MPPRLSVIIPTFNRRPLVERAVTSVLNQSDPIGTDVWVADDGSTDGTLDHLQEKFSGEISAGRLHLLKLEPKCDPGATRNRGVVASRGEFIAFLDSDDSWTSQRLIHLHPLLDQNDLILACAPHLRPTQTSDPLKTLLHANVAATSGAVIKRALFEKLGGFAEGYYGPNARYLSGWEDYELWLLALTSTSRIALTSLEDIILQPTVGSAGSVGLRRQMRRELFSLLRISSHLHVSYWPTTLRRILGASKATLLGK